MFKIFIIRIVRFVQIEDTIFKIFMIRMVRLGEVERGYVQNIYN